VLDMKFGPAPTSKMTSRSAERTSVTLQSGRIASVGWPASSSSLTSSSCGASGKVKLSGSVIMPSLTTVSSALPVDSVCARAVRTGANAAPPSTAAVPARNVLRLRSPPFRTMVDIGLPPSMQTFCFLHIPAKQASLGKRNAVLGNGRQAPVEENACSS